VAPSRASHHHRFVDSSGATLERRPPAALAAAKAGEFDVLLVYRIDRLTAPLWDS